MVDFLKLVGEVFDALTADGAENVQLVIAPQHAGAALSIQWKMKVRDLLFDVTGALSREALEDSHGAEYIAQAFMKDALARLQAVMITGKTEASDG